VGAKTISFEDHFFGRVAIALEYVTPERLQVCLAEFGATAPDVALPAFLVRRGLLTAPQVEAVRRIQRQRRAKHLKPDVLREDERALGEALLAAGVVGLDALESACLEKERLFRRHVQVHVGEVLVRRRVVGEGVVRGMLRARRGEVRMCAPCDCTVLVGPGVPEERWVCPRCGSRLSTVGFLQLVETDASVTGCA
jgi:hypothetical protein